MRYPQGGGLTAERRAARERLRLQAAELAQFSRFVAAHTWSRPAVDLGLADPFAQRLGAADPQLGG
jgi:hypothetical protein